MHQKECRINSSSSMFPHVSCQLIVTPTPRLLLLLGQRSAPKYRDDVRAQTWGYFQFMTETRQTPKYWRVLPPLFLGPYTCHQSLKWSTHVAALSCDSKNMHAVRTYAAKQNTLIRPYQMTGSTRLKGQWLEQQKQQCLRTPLLNSGLRNA